VLGSDKLAGANFTIEKGAAPMQPQRRVERTAVNMDWGFDEAGDEAEGLEAPAPRQARDGGESAADGEGNRRRKRRRRRGRRGDRPESEGYADNGRDASDMETSEDGAAMNGDDDAGGEFNDEPREEQRAGGEERSGQRSRRRGRRGGRRGRERRAATEGHQLDAGSGEQPDVGGFDADGAQVDTTPREPEPHREAAPKSREAERSRPHEPVTAEPAFAAENAYAGAKAETVAEHAEPVTKEVAPKRARHRASDSEPRIERIVVGKTGEPAPASDVATEEEAVPVRKGWWQRRLGGE
jgi:ribonuclease E